MLLLAPEASIVFKAACVSLACSASLMSASDESSEDIESESVEEEPELLVLEASGSSRLVVTFKGSGAGSLGAHLAVRPSLRPVRAKLACFSKEMSVANLCASALSGVTSGTCVGTSPHTKSQAPVESFLPTEVAVKLSACRRVHFTTKDSMALVWE